MLNFRKRLSGNNAWLDLGVVFLLALGVFVLYVQTLVPSVLDGDQGELQFIPSVLGIPHPSGFPLYLLIGHLWSLLPIGSLAYRMNLLSAFFGALTVGALFLLLRRQRLHWLAALGGSLALALAPQFWQFSTVAATYRLHNFLIVLLFFCLIEWDKTQQIVWLRLSALMFGLDLANHLTILFFAPAIILFGVIVAGRSLPTRLRDYLASIPLLVLPLALYAYFPLQGLRFDLNDLVLPGLPRAVAQGMVSPFFEEGLGLLQYVTGAAFFNTVTGNWQWNFKTLFQDWSALVLQDATLPIVICAFCGALWLIARRARFVVLLIGVVLTLQLIALQYSYAGLATIGQFSSYFREYYLPSLIALVILSAWGIDALLRGFQAAVLRSGFRHVAVTSALANLLVIVMLIATAQDLTMRRSTILNDRSAEIESKWAIIHRFPPEQDAALVGHWGDLTPLWYYQQAEGWRRDVLAIYPPTDEWIDAWIGSGKPLYFAGSLLNWATDVPQKYRLTPWGALVRVTGQDYAPSSPLANSSNSIFKTDRPVLRLLGRDLSAPATRVGDALDVALYWECLEAIRLDDYVVYLSLQNRNGETAREGYTLVVNWLPGNKLTAGQRALETYRVTIPWGTPPGKYSLRLGIYSTRGATDLDVIEEDQTHNTIEIGQVEVGRANDYPETVTTANPVNLNFGRQVALLGWNGDLKQLKTGESASVQFLWKSRSPLGDLTTTLRLQGRSGERDLGTTPLANGYPSSSWRVGEIVRGDDTFIVPADLLEGDYTLLLGLQDSQQHLLQPYNNWFPSGDSPWLSLTQVRITARSHSYEIPSGLSAQPANFENRIALLGYALPRNSFRAGDSIQLNLYWQAQALIDKSYKVFAHLVDADGHIWAQQDNIPGAGTLPTTGWLPREVISDSFDIVLPATMSEGTYQIQIGFYDSVSGQRLRVSDNIQRAGADFVILRDSITISAK